MQIWQLFNVLRQPVNISVTVFSNSTKLANYLFILPIEVLASKGVSLTEVQEGLKLRGEICPLHLVCACTKYRAHSLDPGQDNLKLRLMTYSAKLALIC